MAKKSQKKNKYAFGGVSMNIDSPSESLSKIRKVTEDALFGAKYDPAVAGLKALGGMATSTGFSMIGSGISEIGGMEGFLGSLNESLGGKPRIDKIIPGAEVTKAAYGGTFGKDIEAEGKEVVETPQGQLAELFGPSHAEGGIDLTVPDGTTIYSKRVKGPDGKSMADRKKKREKTESYIEDLLQSNPSDKLLKNTMNRVKKNNKAVDDMDVAKMEFIRNLIGSTQGGKFATGGLAWGNDEELQYDDLINKYPVYGKGIDKLFASPITSTPTGTTGAITGSTTDTTPASKSTFGSLLGSVFGGEGGFSLGDITGLAGTLVSTFGPIQNTLKNRSGDTPNVNAFKNYGEEGLAKLDQSKVYVGQVRDNKLQDLELSRQGTIARNNNSARGLNTLRALNLATDSSANNTKAEIYNQFAQAMQSILSQEAQMENEQDKVVMQGEYMKDVADRQDRDKFFSNLAQDISTMGTGLQQTGKHLNTVKTRNVTGKLLNDLYNNYDINSMTGEIKYKASEEIKSDPSFYSNPKLNREVSTKIFQGEFVRKGNEVFDKEGNKVNIETGEVLKGFSKGQLDQMMSWFSKQESYTDKLGTHYK